MADIERSVVEGLRLGEEQAYLAVVERLLGPLHRFLLRLCRDPGVAEDLAQETFVAVWQGIGSYRGRSRFTTWVFGIAYRQYLRHRDRRSVDTVPLVAEHHEAAPADPATLLVEAETRRLLHQAISDLPDACREALLLGPPGGLQLSRGGPSARPSRRDREVADECRFHTTARTARRERGERR